MNEIISTECSYYNFDQAGFKALGGEGFVCFKKKKLLPKAGVSTRKVCQKLCRNCFFVPENF